MHKLLLYGRRGCVLFMKPSKRFLASMIYLFLLLFCSKNDAYFLGRKVKRMQSIVVHDVVDANYCGRISTLENMKASCTVAGFDGLSVHVGPSTLGFGLGLFISVNDNASTVKIPEGTLICEYSKGELNMRHLGDKSVAYDFDEPSALVFHKDKVKSVEDAILDRCTDNADGGSLSSGRLEGHFVKLKDGALSISPNVRMIYYSLSLIAPPHIPS